MMVCLPSLPLHDGEPLLPHWAVHLSQEDWWMLHFLEIIWWGLLAHRQVWRWPPHSAGFGLTRVSTGTDCKSLKIVLRLVRCYIRSDTIGMNYSLSWLYQLFELQNCSSLIWHCKFVSSFSYIIFIIICMYIFLLWHSLFKLFNSKNLWMLHL